MQSKKLYCVRSGRKTGIFNTWNECKQQIDGFPFPVYKSFKSMEECTEWCKIPLESIIQRIKYACAIKLGKLQEEKEELQEEENINLQQDSITLAEKYK